MKNIIILEKVREKKKLWEDTADTTTLAEVAQVSSFVNFAWHYWWVISNANIDAAKRLGLTRIEKYWRRADQVKMELD